jgi:hypothetical protein
MGTSARRTRLNAIFVSSRSPTASPSAAAMNAALKQYFRSSSSPSLPDDRVRTSVSQSAAQISSPALATSATDAFSGRPKKRAV